MIVKTKNGYKVVSESKNKKGKHKNLSSDNLSLAAAKRRLLQVEYFKHKGK